MFQIKPLKLLLFLCVLVHNYAHAEDPLLKFKTPFTTYQFLYATPKLGVDTGVKKIIPVPLHNPKKAILLSAVLPGAGQIYNQKYWKAPVVWVALGACGYLIQNNNKQYRDYKDALLMRVDTTILETDKYFGVYSTDQLIALQDQFRQNRDLFIIVTTLVYVLNMVDALVDAHLFTFDVSDDLSFRWQPYFKQSFAAQRQSAGIQLSLSFK